MPAGGPVPGGAGRRQYPPPGPLLLCAGPSPHPLRSAPAVGASAARPVCVGTTPALVFRAEPPAPPRASRHVLNTRAAGRRPAHLGQLRAWGHWRGPRARAGGPVDGRGLPSLSSHTACTAGSSGWVGALGGPRRPGRSPAPQQPTSDTTPTAPSTAPTHGQACLWGTAREGDTETGPPDDGAGPAPQSAPPAREAQGKEAREPGLLTGRHLVSPGLPSALQGGGSCGPGSGSTVQLRVNM